MMPGETIFTGAERTCSECGVTPKFQVYKSPAGFYVGTMCKCGPYSRESGYYETKEEAQRDLNQNTFSR